MESSMKEETPSVSLEQQQQQGQETLSPNVNTVEPPPAPVRRKRPPPPSLSTAPPADATHDGRIPVTLNTVPQQQQQQQQQQAPSALYSHHQQNVQNQQEHENEHDGDWSGNLSTAFYDHIGVPGRSALHKFFYPPARDNLNNASEGSHGGPEPAPLGDNVSSNGTHHPAPPPPPLPPPPLPTLPTPPASQQQQQSQQQSQQHRQVFDDHFLEQDEDDKRYVERFWTAYDDIIILSLFTQIGIVFRLGAATWFTYFDAVFTNDSALFANLPLNCFSCFMMGVLCSGERLMEIIGTRFTPPHLQQELQQNLLRDVTDNDNGYAEENDDDEDHDDDEPDAVMMLPIDSDEELEQDGIIRRTRSNSSASSNTGIRRRPRRGQRRPQQHRRPKKQRQQHQQQQPHVSQPKTQTYFKSWQPPLHLHDELRDVQLLALERRIRASKCLVLFPIRKEDVDVMEHYFHEGYKPESPRHGNDHDNNNNGHDNDNTHDNYDPSDFDLSLEVEVEAKPERRRQPNSSTLSPPPVATLTTLPPGVARLPTSGNATMPKTPIAAAAARSVDTNVANQNVKRTEDAQDAKPRAKIKNDNNNDMMLKTEQKPALPLVVDHGKMKIKIPKVKPVDALVGSMPLSPVHDDQEDPMTMHTVDLEEEHAEPTHARPSLENGAPISSSEEEEHAENEIVELHGDTSQYDLDQILHEVSANVTENVSRLRRVDLADGWDRGTTPEDMSDDLMLGLRDGFCGAVSSFSSWNSAMVNLLREGQVGEAIVGYLLGMQLPIVSYRFGQHVAVYIFIWRTRRETRRDERRGYGIRVSMNDFSDRDSAEEMEAEDPLSPASSNGGHQPKASFIQDIPSVRAVATAIFLLVVVTEGTSLSFFSDPMHQQLALSLLFSPLGVLARWRLSKYNNWRPSFPVGTFISNMLACALSGGFGSLLAGNPGPRERIVLVSFIAGFGGTLSSVGNFIVEVLAGVDPILLRFDGIVYAVLSIFWAMVIGILFSASADWADEASD